jgi:histidyl-tRNA synthetase
VLDQATALVAGSERGEAGVARLRDVVAGASAGGVPIERLNIDVSIARGLDYYTGTIVETFLGQLPNIGSVCSGGRYDDLAGTYTKQQLPGIGASLGLDRLLAAMEELSLLSESSSPAPVLITQFDGERLNEYLGLAKNLRANGIGAEVYPDTKKIGQQLKFADRRGFRLAIIAGVQEFERGQVQIKDLKTGEASDVALEADGASIVAHIKSLLG